MNGLVLFSPLYQEFNGDIEVIGYLNENLYHLSGTCVIEV